MNCSPPGSSAHEILQARILEWVADGELLDLGGRGGVVGRNWTMTGKCGDYSKEVSMATTESERDRSERWSERQGETIVTAW